MLLSITITLSILIIALLSIIRTLSKAIKSLNNLIIKFVEQNQKFYESQNLIIKHQKEISTEFQRQISNIDIFNKQITKVENMSRTINSAIIDMKTLTQKESDNQKLLADISKHVAETSHNIKILDNVADKLKNILMKSNRKIK